MWYEKIDTDMTTNRNGKTITSSERFSIISQVYSEFREFRSEHIEKGIPTCGHVQGEFSESFNS
jgi:hypothetical protein